MLWFTSDGGMIAGCDMFETAVMEGLRSAAATVEASFGYVTGEEPPPDTVGEFLTICRTADLRLVDGSVVDSMSE
jgi:hypothetical protein